MKIALAPDIHCYYTTYGRIVTGGENFRKTEWERVADAMVDVCEKNKVDVFVAPGDYFTNPRPSASQVLMVANLFRRVEGTGAKVLGLCGNHDLGSSGAFTSNEVVSAIGDNPLWDNRSIGTHVIGDVGFGFLPFLRDADVIANNPDYATLEMSELLTAKAAYMAKELQGEGVKKRILIGHWALSGSVSSSGQAIDGGREVVLPLGGLVAQGWDAILFGHIHKPQVLSEKPFAAYSGAMQRVNIGEWKDERGMYLYDTDTGEYSFEKLPAIEMEFLTGEVEDEESREDFLSTIENADLEGKIVAVRYSISKEHIALISRNEIISLLEKKGVLAIAGVAPHIKEVMRQRDVSLTESLDGGAALKKWLSNKEADDERKEKVLALFEEITLRMEKDARGTV